MTLALSRSASFPRFFVMICVGCSSGIVTQTSFFRLHTTPTELNCCLATTLIRRVSPFLSSFPHSFKTMNPYSELCVAVVCCVGKSSAVDHTQACSPYCSVAEHIWTFCLDFGMSCHILLGLTLLCRPLRGLGRGTPSESGDAIEILSECGSGLERW